MFTINNRLWRIRFVSPDSDYLRRSDGTLTVGVTDGGLNTVFISDNLTDDFLRKVLCHELCHVFCFSYNIEMPIEQEEFMADWLSLYGEELIYLLDDLMTIILSKTA